MSTAKRLVLSLRGRNESQNGGGESSTRLYSSSSPGHELDEIAVVSCGADSARVSYGSLSLGGVGQAANGPRYVPGKLITVNFLYYKYNTHTHTLQYIFFYVQSLSSS